MKKNNLTKSVMLLICLVILLQSVLAVNEFKPYLHNPEVPKHPNLNLYGSFQAELWPGAATYSFGIEVPPGRNGLQPQLSLSYNNHLTNGRPGIVGAAWSLTQNYIYRDVDYSFADTSDDKFRLVLNGQSHELVFVASENRYHTKIESFLHITKVNGGSNSRGEYWIVKTKDGTSYRFGHNQDSELVSNLYSYVTRWSLDLVEDTHNNQMYFSYKESPTANDINAVYPHKIEYNNEKSRVIEFILENVDRPDKWLVYEQGNKIREARRIKEIHVKANNQLVRKYALTYITLDTKAKSFVSTITVFGSDGTPLPSTKFEYNKISKGWVEDSRWKIPYEASFSARTDHGVRFVDLNRDGYVDISKADYTEKSTWINTKNGWELQSQWNLPYSGSVDKGGDDTGLRFVDLNGDGLTDIVRGDGPSDRGSWINTGSGWNRDSGWNLPLGAQPIKEEEDNFDKGVRFVDLNGDGQIDILLNAGSSQRAWLNHGNGWSDNGAWKPPPDAEFVDSLRTPEDEGVRLADVNGDGLADIIRGDGSSSRETWLNTGNGWRLDETFTIPVEAYFVSGQDGEDQGVRLADVNGDGLIDILKGEGGNQKAWINNGQGWSEDSSWKIPAAADFVTGVDGENKAVRIADVNGDGLPDIIKSDRNRKTWLNKASKTYLLNIITNEFGGKINIDYKQSTLIDNSGDDSLSDIGFNMWVVDRVTENNDMSGAQSITPNTNYNYFNGLYDYQEKEFVVVKISRYL